MGSNDDDINDLEKLYTELQAEIDFFVAKDKGYIDPIALSSVERRLFVRSVFSFIEAAVFRIKTGALFWDTSKLLPYEIALINEEDYELDDTGTVKTRRARLRFSGNFRFAFAVAAKAAGVTYQLDVGGDGWRALRDSVKVRDRLMHPKRSADLVVTDAEVREAMEAFRWVMDQMGRLAAASLLHKWSSSDS
jgi:hypothetical protein